MNFIAKAGLASMQRSLALWMSRREKVISYPEDVEMILDLSYAADGKPCHRMDLYRPESRTGPLPVIVNLHGGGLLLCTKEVNRQYCTELAARGYLVICPEYPLAPEHSVFEILRDVSAAMDAVGSVMESFGGAPGPVFLAGDSAGAFLGLYTAAAQRCPAVRQALGIPVTSLPIAALGLISGMFYTVRPDSIGLPLRRDFYGKQWKTHPFFPYMNPEHPEILGNLPPCFLVTSKFDKLRGYTMRYASALRKAGHPFELREYPADVHLSHCFPVIYPELPASADVMTRMLAFFRASGT